MAIRNTIKKFIINIFLLQPHSKHISSLVGFTVCLGVLAVAFEFLRDWGGTIMIIPIPDEAKVWIVQLVYWGALAGAGYFLIRFILGFFIKGEDKPSPELQALKNLETKLDRLIEITEAKGNGTTNHNPKM